MVQKHRISTNIGSDQKITVELNQDFDFLEILSLKFTQQDIYASLCSDYGVVCGRITANNGLGIPNARVSIFVPQRTEDANDPVISALYPFTDTSVKNENNYRYNLLPSRQQHGGHTPTGTFPDQKDILTREEVLEVYENYYNYTVKTNESGDFMIWGVPVGNQTIHVDIDLSDIGCFSLRPYDFIKKGVGADNFERFYKFKSSEDIDGLPQIVQFEKSIEVSPFWGNIDICEIGISRVDFDLSQSGIKIEPISLILASTFTDDNSDAVKRSGVIRRNSGYKCNLQTTEGRVECVRYTGNKVYGSDGVTLYPELEYFNITETIDENGTAMIVLPMNMEYVYTNEFGEQEITNDPNKGIATTTAARFRFTLETNDTKTGPASYLVPQIREYTKDYYGYNDDGEYNETLLSTYQFSNVFEDYLNIIPPSGMTLDTNNLMDGDYSTDKANLMLGKNNDNIPEDVFYKFIFGKVYTVSSFQGSHYEVSGAESFFGLSRRDAFLGIKEIRPNTEDDCSTKVNYFPTNFAFRNRIKFGLVISEVLLFIQYIYTIVILWVNETLGSIFYSLGGTLMGFNFLGDYWFWNAGVGLRTIAYRIMEAGQTILPLTTYPDCEECTVDTEFNGNRGLSTLNLYLRSMEIKTKIVPQGDYIYLVFLSGQTPTYFNNSTTTGATFLPEIFPNQAPREIAPAGQISPTGITESQLTSLHIYKNPQRLSEQRFIAGIYPLPGSTGTTETFRNMFMEFNSSFVDTQLNSYFQTVTVSESTNTVNSILVDKSDPNIVYVRYVNTAGGQIPAPENITVKLLLRNPCDYTYSEREVTILSGQSETFTTMRLNTCADSSTQVEVYERIISFSPFGYREYNTGGSITYSNVPALKISYSYWARYAGKDYSQGGIEKLKDLYAVIRLYDRNASRTTELTELEIETGCSKYDKFYNATGNTFTYLWANLGDYGTVDDVTNVNNVSGPSWVNNSKRATYNYGQTNNSYYLLGKPYYVGTPYSESLTSPGPNYSIVATLAGDSTTRRLPNVVDLENGDESFIKKTKSGLTEIRDGVFTIVPVIDGTSKNQSVVREWYKRKRVGMFFCGGVVNYSFIDNWLNGILYFFKFDRRIKWDNEEIYDLSQGRSKFPRELVFYNVLHKRFYYRATPYTPTRGFIGQSPSFSYKEILHPTTFYDVGVRDEFLYEICQDPRIDPTCSVIRDITPTSYQDPANVVEYAINYRLDISDGKFDVGDFFTGTAMGERVSIFDGDITQLMSINCEAGIEAFDLESPHYVIYNGEFMDPENSYFASYFKSGSNYSPVPIDFKFDLNGAFIRQCLNFRLGDYSQKVPFYLWDKRGEGFGEYGNDSDKQSWNKTKIASMKLQRLFSINDEYMPGTGYTTNYNFADGEEEYLLKPMTITHPQYSFTGNTTDMLERFENISLLAPDTTPNAAQYTNVEGDIWLHVQSGTTTNPASGTTYVVVNKTWTAQPDPYIHNYREMFMFQTQQNYSGNKQVLSTPFMFYFGLRPEKTALDMLIKYYGPKNAFPPIE